MLGDYFPTRYIPAASATVQAIPAHINRDRLNPTTIPRAGTPGRSVQASVRPPGHGGATMYLRLSACGRGPRWTPARIIRKTTLASTRPSFCTLTVHAIGCRRCGQYGEDAIIHMGAVLTAEVDHVVGWRAVCRVHRRNTGA